MNLLTPEVLRIVGDAFDRAATSPGNAIVARTLIGIGDALRMAARDVDQAERAAAQKTADVP